MESIPENAEQLLELLRNAAVRTGDAGHRFRLENGQLAQLSFERNLKRDDEDEYPRARDKSKGDNTRVRTKVVLQGRAYFEKTLGGEEDYKRYVESSKAEIARRQSLDEDERYIEDYAEISKLPVSTMRLIMTGTYDELAAWIQTLDPKHPDDQRIFLAIMFGRMWRDYFSSR